MYIKNAMKSLQRKLIDIIHNYKPIFRYTENKNINMPFDTL